MGSRFQLDIGAKRARSCTVHHFLVLTAYLPDFGLASRRIEQSGYRAAHTDIVPCAVSNHCGAQGVGVRSSEKLIQGTM